MKLSALIILVTSTLLVKSTESAESKLRGNDVNRQLKKDEQDKNKEKAKKDDLKFDKDQKQKDQKQKDQKQKDQKQDQKQKQQKQDQKQKQQKQDQDGDTPLFTYDFSTQPMVGAWKPNQQGGQGNLLGTSFDFPGINVNNPTSINPSGITNPTTNPPPNEDNGQVSNPPPNEGNGQVANPPPNEVANPPQNEGNSQTNQNNGNGQVANPPQNEGNGQNNQNNGNGQAQPSVVPDYAAMGFDVAPTDACEKANKPNWVWKDKEVPPRFTVTQMYKRVNQCNYDEHCESGCCMIYQVGWKCCQAPLAHMKCAGSCSAAFGSTETLQDETVVVGEAAAKPNKL